MRGFVIEEYENALCADLAAASAARDARVEVPGDHKAWAEYSARGFSQNGEPDEPLVFAALLMASHPQVTPLLLRVNGVAATTGCLAVEDDGIAAFFASSTLAESRGRGYHRAMIEDRLARAKVAGATLVRATAGVGTTSERNFRRCGFDVLYTRSTWALFE